MYSQWPRHISHRLYPPAFFSNIFLSLVIGCKGREDSRHDVSEGWHCQIFDSLLGQSFLQGKCYPSPYKGVRLTKGLPQWAAQSLPCWVQCKPSVIGGKDGGGGERAVGVPCSLFSMCYQENAARMGAHRALLTMCGEKGGEAKPYFFFFLWASLRYLWKQKPLWFDYKNSILTFMSKELGNSRWRVKIYIYILYICA